MKKNISLFLCFVLVIGLMVSPAVAVDQHGIHFVDGNAYLIIEADTYAIGPDFAYVLPGFFDIYEGGPQGKVLDYWEYATDHDVDVNAYVVNYDTANWAKLGYAGDTVYITAPDVLLRPVFKDAPVDPGTGGGSTTEKKTEEFKLPELAAGPDYFDDVFMTDWFYDVVIKASKLGIMVGYGNHKFGPNDPTSSAVMIQVLYNLSGAKVEKISDKYAGEWYAEAATWAEASGISFSADSILTRENAIVMLYNFAKSAGLVKDDAAKGDLTRFGDAADVSASAKEALEWAVGAGIINGMGNGNVEPLGATTRAQIAAMIVRLVG